MKDTYSIRYPAVAGLFYSSGENKLRDEIKVYLSSAEKIKDIKEIRGLVAPHAGYMYSGAVAAHAYRQLEGKKYKTVVVVSPSHRVYFKENAVFPGAYYRTPLGDIEVDSDLAETLCKINSRVVLSGSGHESAEHALEVQLPFLQVVLGKFNLVPIIMGDQNRENITALAESLSAVFKDKNALLVASSDLSHYHNGKLAQTLDGHIVDYINAFDSDKLSQALENGESEMCGGGPVMSVMKASRMMGADKSKVLVYRNSGDVTGDYKQVVGYLSAVFYN